MNKKFFSLIHAESVHIAPDTQKIPAEELASLQQALDVLKVVKEDAEKYRKQVIAECETLKEQAQHAGFAAGFQEWMERIAALEEEIKKVHKDMERLVLPIALKAAKKIVNKELEVSPDAILAIVSANIKSVAQHKRITIYVNPQELQTLETERSKLKALFENLEALSIRPRKDIQLGGCMIETEVGIINAQLDDRWRVLEAAFETMTKGK